MIRLSLVADAEAERFPIAACLSVHVHQMNFEATRLHSETTAERRRQYNSQLFVSLTSRFRDYR